MGQAALPRPACCLVLILFTRSHDLWSRDRCRERTGLHAVAGMRCGGLVIAKRTEVPDLRVQVSRGRC